jgi:hypothetical protein
MFERYNEAIKRICDDKAKQDIGQLTDNEIERIYSSSYYTDLLASGEDIKTIKNLLK